MWWEMQKCDICGKESKFQSFWIFCINRTVIEPRFFPRLWVLRRYGSKNPEIVRICRKCRYDKTLTIADMYDVVMARMMNRSVRNYAKASKKNKRAKQKRPRTRRKNRSRF